MEETSRSSKHRILMVDDNPSIHEDFQKVLLTNSNTESQIAEKAAALFGGEEEFNSHYSLEFEMDSAFQGQEALTMVIRALEEKRPYSLAFVDIRMPPGWDGIETISQLWKVDPTLHIVICTAFSDYSLDDIIERVGLNDRMVILKKPFDNIEALQLANALTQKWSLQLETNDIYEELLQRTDKSERELETAQEHIRELEERVERLSKKAAAVEGDTPPEEDPPHPELITLEGVAQLKEFSSTLSQLLDQFEKILVSHANTVSPEEYETMKQQLTQLENGIHAFPKLSTTLEGIHTFISDLNKA